MQLFLSFIGLSFLLALNEAYLTRLIKSPSTTSRKIVTMTTKSDLDTAFEEDENLLSIAEMYLTNKFQKCEREDGCRLTIDRNDAKLLLREILPPVTPIELEREVDQVVRLMSMGKKTDEDIQETEFIRAVLGNSYWREAGPLVVKELMFLDCLDSNYFKKVQLIDDERYDMLKESLQWEGSAVATLSGKEAHFIFAVAAYQRGKNIISDEEYGKLKADLQAANSWVVNRGQDPLERLGMNTFLGYLHRRMSNNKS